MNCYGRYVPHKDEFQKYYQPDLAALVGQNETPLGFAFGYHWQKEDGLLMLATPRSSTGASGRGATAKSARPKMIRRRHVAPR